MPQADREETSKLQISHAIEAAHITHQRTINVAVTFVVGRNWLRQSRICTSDDSPMAQSQATTQIAIRDMPGVVIIVTHIQTLRIVRQFATASR